MGVSQLIGWFAFIVVAVAIFLGMALILRKWGTRVAKRHVTVWWQRAAWLPFVAFFVAAIGLATAAAMILHVLGRLDAVEPSLRAAALADGVAQAANCGALILAMSLALDAAVAVLFAVGMMRR